MSGFVDLHCHWLPGVDDGARDLEEACAMLAGLGALGFERVVATPHMRPGLFENTRDGLSQAFERAEVALAAREGLPARALASEHFFDEIVFQRLCSGAGLPYPGEAAALLEFYESSFPPRVDQLLIELRRRGLTPVIAHPERYQALWEHPDVLERLLDLGAVALLDISAVVGKYGRRPERAAREFLEAGLYHAACSDAHRSADVKTAAEAMKWVRRRYGQEELERLFRLGPLEILSGSARPRDGRP